jgi:hypothetical protein
MKHCMAHPVLIAGISFPVNGTYRSKEADYGGLRKEITAGKLKL